MPHCLICKRPVTTAFVMCGYCAKSLEPYTLPPELAYFIDQLAEEIVLDGEINRCSMCAIGECTFQVSGLTCRNAIKAWLLKKAQQYFANITRSDKTDDKAISHC